jgi:signal transduction histidine kinase
VAADTDGVDEGAVVLVVDDSAVNRIALKRGVERLGHDVLVASDGAEAIEVLRQQRVDMVLLDLLMPQVDGFEVLAALARDPQLRDTPVLVISATERADEVARAIELGAIDVLPKPFDPTLLRVRVGTALERTRLQRLERAYLRQELALRQQERLATLGRLSAGLGHELNNPAAAALAAARQLEDALADADAAGAAVIAHARALTLQTANEVLEAACGPPPVTAVEGADREEELAERLASAAVRDAWRVAADLAAAGVHADVLGELSDLDPGEIDLVLDRWRSRRRVVVAAAQVQEGVRRIAELTGALRGYAYLDRAPQQDVDVRRGLDDTLSILGHRLPDGVEVRRDYDATLPTIHAYGGQLNQVWTNLLDNAMDAVSGGGTIVVRARAADPDRAAGVLVEIEDDGPGIPDELVGRVFDPFVTTKPPGAGTGLGLNVAHQIVADRHGGRIGVDSAPGRTVFQVELPRQLPPGEDAATSQEGT